MLFSHFPKVGFGTGKMTDKERVSKFESDDIPPAPNILPCGPGRSFWFLESSYKIHVLRSSNEA